MSDDRTAEFLSLASSIPSISSTTATSSLNVRGGSEGFGSSQNTAAAAQKPKANPDPLAAMSPAKSAAYAELRTFHRTASQISSEIRRTSGMLAELTSLVKARNLFVDDAERVDSLVARIKGAVESLHVRLEECSEGIEASKRRLGRGSQAGQEASNLVGQLRQDFAVATHGFKDVLQERSDWMRERNERGRDIYGASGTGGGATEDRLVFGNRPPIYESGSLIGGGGSSGGGGVNAFPKLDLTGASSSVSRNDQGSGESTHQLPRPHGSNFGNDLLRRRSRSGGGSDYGGSSSFYGNNPYDDPSANAPTVLTPLEMARLDQESQTMQLIPDQTYLRQRADAMSTVETNIVELGTIFNKLATMVNEHREVVQRLEDNVADADRNISLSLDSLTQTLTNLRSNRALFTKVLSIITFFVILFIVFFA